MATINLVFKGEGPLPTKGYPDDAGMDLHAWIDGGSGAMEIEPGEFVDVPCGLSMALREGYWAMIVGRSSSIRKRGLLVYTGIIDTGYRGELFCGVLNVGKQTVTVESGERLSQLIIFQNWTQAFRPVRVADDLFPTSARGGNGFGSTGQ